MAKRDGIKPATIVITVKLSAAQRRKITSYSNAVIRASPAEIKTWLIRRMKQEFEDWGVTARVSARACIEAKSSVR